MESGRRYSDREVDALLARAVELSRAADPGGGGEGSRAGLSLAELERIAAEAGLPAGAIQRAAEELESRRGGGLLGRLKGAERAELPALPGRPELERLLAELPDLACLSGSGTVTETGLLWRSDGASEMRSGRKLRVELRPALEGTGGAIVDVRHDLGGAAGGIYGGIIGGLGVGAGMGIGFGFGMGALGSPLFALLFLTGSILLSALGARGLVGLVSRHAERKSRELAQDIAGALAPAPHPPGGRDAGARSAATWPS